MLRRDVRRALGARLRRMREEKGLSRRELGDRSGLSEMTVGLIENGRKPVRLEDLLCVATGLRVPAAELLGPGGESGERGP